MQPLHRPGEINFYEELGVASDASPEEIRDAFRSLARLLHPDQQTDEQLKEIAERQMRKLNPIYAVLSDPERRRRYDEDLLDSYQGPIIINNAPPRSFHRLAGRLAWVGAILLSAGLLFWLSSDSTTSGPQSLGRIENLLDPPASKPPSTPVESAAEINRLRGILRIVVAERDSAIRELSSLRGTASGKDAPSAPNAALSSTPLPAFVPPPAAAHHEDRPSTMTAMTELPSPPHIPMAAPLVLKTESPALEAKLDAARIPAPAPRHRLAGFWFYVKPAQGQKNKNQTLYPPEYIEAVITEDNGVLHGKYRSRFQIVDRAISPEVNFSFSGTPNGPSIVCPWTGPGGARGELTLRMVSENSIKVEWTASELGTQQGLISGTAVLTRKIE
ncbi:MAG TPA: J domain-containing protein [Bryobacteraceae bacterium]|jgi:hypothetical protein|nr:J domain-containing protein [Bryobacteraceae bacterium]